MNQQRPFLLDVDKAMNFCFVSASPESLGQANFLSRDILDFDSTSEHKIPMAEFRTAHQRKPANYIFHTAFCGSTLLSRALHAPPSSVALKEPHVLFRISEASLKLPDDALRPHLDNVLAEITQPWALGGRVVIKPTNSCNRLAPRMLDAGLDDRVLFMYSSLEEFLISCLKKLPEAETRVNWMARHLLPGSALERDCGIPRRDFNLLEACVLSWCVSLQYFSEAIRSNPMLKFKVLAYRDFMAEPAQRAREVGLHFCIEEALLSPEFLQPRLGDNAKNAGTPFNREQHTTQTEIIRSTYGDAIQDALKWAEESIAPFANIHPIFQK
jgi:hypothetical protein